MFSKDLQGFEKPDMYLSVVYNNKKLWCLVYHTRPGSTEVELITNRFFKSSKAAFRWFNNKRVASAFIEPEAVEVSGLGKLSLGMHLPVTTKL